MSKHFMATVFCSTLSLIGAGGFALAETIGRYECSIIGTTSVEAIGDRPGHSLANAQFSCFGVEGLLKGAVYTASNISEWDGPQGRFVSAGGIHRTPGGLAVTQAIEGTASVVVRDGKSVGTESSGSAVFKFASGVLVALSGKSVKFISRPGSAGRFDLEFSD